LPDTSGTSVGAAQSDPLEDVTVALAAALARDGRRGEAEGLLAVLPEPASASRLDLLARLRAQEGDLDVAEGYWKQVREGDAMAPAAAAGLRRIEVLRGRPRWLRFNLWFGVAVLAVCAVVAAGATGVVVAIAGGDDGNDSAPALAAGSDPVATSSPSPAVQATPTPTSSRAAIPAPQPPDVAFTTDSAMFASRGDAQVVTFKHGLFAPGGAVLLPRGKLALLGIAQGLSSAGDPLKVLVIGHTDSVPPGGGGLYADNAALGFARAATAADFLRRHSELPLAAFTTASAGSGDPVATNGSVAGRQRNRTVVLEIRMR
jgi:outer membrane protein OmpA-like peptidoglycan-associated protein